MRPENLAECIEKAFVGLDLPPSEEMPVRCGKLLTVAAPIRAARVSNAQPGTP